MSEKELKVNEDEEMYRLTPFGCLYAVCLDYNVDMSHLSGKLGEHLVEDFMEALEKNGYLKCEVEK